MSKCCVWLRVISLKVVFQGRKLPLQNVLWYIPHLHSVLCLIQEEIIPHYLKGRTRKEIMRKTSLVQASSTQACLSRRCHHRPVLDPDIKGLRESFPPFRLWADVPAPSALICATSLPIISWNDTLFKSLSPLVNTDSLGLLTQPHITSQSCLIQTWQHFASCC